MVRYRSINTVGMFLSFANCLILALAGCSHSLQPASIDSANSAQLGSEILDTQHEELPNMNTLEDEDDIALFGSAEQRALTISNLWYKHGERMQESSVKGSLASFMRAAHFAGEALQSEACSDPFNETCGELRIGYRLALKRLVQLVAKGNWVAPELAPTKYRLELLNGDRPLELAGWQIHLPTAEWSKSTYRRAGIGLEAVACSPTELPLTICVPLTFVLTFDAPTDSERIGAQLSTFDGYQHDMIKIGERELSLAADFAAAWRLLVEQARLARSPKLFCLSTPTSLATTLIAITDITTATPTWTEEYAALSNDALLRSHYDLCLYPVSKQLRAEPQGRNLLNILRKLSANVNVSELQQPTTQAFFVADGDSASAVLMSFLGHVKRQRADRTSTTSEAILKISGVYLLMRQGQLQAPARLLATEKRFKKLTAQLKIPLSGAAEPPAPGQLHPFTAQLKGLRKTLYELIEIETHETPPVTGTPTEEPEKLELSPIY